MSEFLRIGSEQRKKLDLLFLAKYAQEWGEPPPVIHPVHGRELYTKYEVLSVLRGLVRSVEPCADLDAFERRMRGKPPDYIFQIYNREAVRNPEILVSSLCARTGVPYLGSPPNVRAMAEDKWITKLMAKAGGLPVPDAMVAVEERDLGTPPHFGGPYFVKPRFGANSEWVDEGSICDDWPAARERAATLLIVNGEEVLIEALAAGMDVTVPVLGGPVALHPVAMRSELREGVSTERQKRNLEPGRRGEPFGDAGLAEELKQAALAFTRLARPCDYLRVDFRVAPDRSFQMLEFNVTCNLATTRAMNIGAQASGISHEAMIEHFLCYSLRRQGVLTE